MARDNFIMAYAFNELLDLMQHLNVLFQWKNSVTQKKEYRFDPKSLTKLHQDLLLLINEINHFDLSTITHQEWEALTTLLTQLLDCERVDWNTFDKKNVPLFYHLFPIVLHPNNLMGQYLLTHLYKRPSILWNKLIINHEGMLSTCLFDFLRNVEHPAILGTLEQLVLIKGLDWKAKNRTLRYDDVTPLYLMLRSIDKTFPAIKILVENTPLIKLPFHQLFTDWGNGDRPIKYQTIRAMERERNPNFDNTSPGEHNNYLMVELAARIKNPSLCKCYIDKIPKKSKLYPEAMTHLMQYYLNQVRPHQVHQPNHSLEQRLDIKKSNSARREDLYHALEIALEMPIDRTFYCTIIATKYIDGKAGVRPFPSDYDDPYLSRDQSRPWLNMLNSPPLLVRQYLDCIRNTRKMTKEVIQLEGKIEGLQLQLKKLHIGERQ